MNWLFKILCTLSYEFVERKSHSCRGICLYAASAINRNLDTRNKAGVVTCEVATGITNVLGSGATAQWNCCHECLLVLWLSKEEIRPGCAHQQRSFISGHENTYKPVPIATTGHTELNLILSFAYSTAKVLVALITAAFDALYQTNCGLGRIPAVEAIFTNAPPLPFFCMYGTIV